MTGVPGAVRRFRGLLFSGFVFFFRLLAQGSCLLLLLHFCLHTVPRFLDQIPLGNLTAHEAEFF